MSSLNFIGGEKGGVGKSVVARVLAQYFIDKHQPFIGFDTDRSHTTFTRFYQDYASPVIVDSYESLDAIALALDEASGEAKPSVIVDLAAQTSAPVARWIHESDLFSVMDDMGVKVNFWHVADAGKDSVDLLDQLVETYRTGPNYVVVKNLGRGTDFSQLDRSSALQKARDFGAQVVSLGQLQESSMRKIDRNDASFWAAVNTSSGPDSLGLLERQRAKHWLRKTYETLESLPL
ncbi:MAG: mobilization protein [Betaproteobacteria bacterium]